VIAGSGAGIGRRALIRAGVTASLLRPALAADRAPLASGTDFALDIGPVGTAIGINGMTPAPILRWCEGEIVTIAVTNRLHEPTSLHWHGIRTPSEMDGVPGFSFAGIAPGATFVYRFPVQQSGTYWYHSHSGYQEQRGLFGAIVVEPKDGYRYRFDRDYIVLLSDWTDEDPATILSNLKFQSDYYNRGRRTLGMFVDDARRRGLGATVADRLAWGGMRMSPTDVLDVSGSVYSYRLNGLTVSDNWTALFRPGERVRLRFVNASAMSIFDVRFPGLPMTMVQADGNDIDPVTVDEFRIGNGETYDAIVRPEADRAFAIFAQVEDRSGFVGGTLAPRLGMVAPMPAMDPRPLRTMADMGMAGMEHGEMADMAAPTGVETGVAIDNVAVMPVDRLHEPGGGLEANGRRVLTYADLRSVRAGLDGRPPERDIVLHLTGNMQRYIWGINGKSFSEAEPIALRHGERVRFTAINDTMMEHPLHLHGLWCELENGHGERRPLKHTILVKPGEGLSFLVTADMPGRWALHCHLMFHMDLGMFREVRVS